MTALNDGFEEISKLCFSWIFSQMPASKQVAVFSATFPNELDKFLTGYMDSPTMIRLDSEDVQLLGIKQYRSLISTQAEDLAKNTVERVVSLKMDRLEALLKQITYSQAMIFCNHQDK